MHLPGAAHARGDGVEQRIGELLLQWRDVTACQPGVQASHAARDVEADTTRRDHPILVGIERSHAADRKAVAPVSIRHRVRCMTMPGNVATLTACS